MPGLPTRHPRIAQRTAQVNITQISRMRRVTTTKSTCTACEFVMMKITRMATMARPTRAFAILA
jgi:hypothetical protein